MLLFLNKAAKTGKIGMEEFVAIGKQRNLPTMNDCAADVPPIEKPLAADSTRFDMVVVSGGKAIRGRSQPAFWRGARI
jgi:L-seryl-tRNA(Ser) seleniumtransferase